MRKFISIMVVVSAGLLPTSVGRAGDEPLTGFDAYVEQALKKWEVPGLAIAIVKDDQVMLAKGYGVRKLGTTDMVNDKTIFAIASCSKAFTAAAVAKLVEDGKLQWDDPVIQHLSLQLFDPWVTRELTVRDLLCHRSGLARHDLLWYGVPYDRDEVLERMKHAKPTWSFRSQFGYQNIMYLAAGQVGQGVSGQSWDDYIRRVFFEPLAMQRTCTRVSELSKFDNVATPHDKIGDKPVPITYRALDNAGPAGSINSCVADLTAWLRLHLNAGSVGKQKLLDPASIREMHSPQMVIRTEGMGPEGLRWKLMNPESEFLTYGLGWIVKDYRGLKIVQHGGTLDGMRCTAALVPSLKLGMVILSNRGGQYLPEAIAYRIFDRFIGGEPKDWSAIFFKNMEHLNATQKELQKKQDGERIANTKPSLAPAAYAGAYRDVLYGEVSISVKNDELRIRYGHGFDGRLVHWHHDTFQVHWQDERFEKELVTFKLDKRGSPAELSWRDMSAKRIVEAK